MSQTTIRKIRKPEYPDPGVRFGVRILVLSLPINHNQPKLLQYCAPKISASSSPGVLGGLWRLWEAWEAFQPQTWPQALAYCSTNPALRLSCEQAAPSLLPLHSPLVIFTPGGRVGVDKNQPATPGRHAASIMSTRRRAAAHQAQADVSGGRDGYRKASNWCLRAP